jgi:3-methylcrotonyl-CoA carboxylase alpha subunit
MFQKILIANRGEISCRIAATAARLGIRTVAVYSDADQNSKHVATADQALRIGGAISSQSYLCIEPIVQAARATGAQAIHPGYGFLAENEAFATACAEAGLTFIGPSPSAIRAMGNKSIAKELAAKLGVPVIPGYDGKSQQDLEREAQAIGYPLLLKASAGGGGKGMRVIERPEDLTAGLASCRREAKNSFGDESLLIEKYLAHTRHVEIQVFGDTYGNFVHLSERDCSVQRRHQKLMEEAPAPGLTPELRRLLGGAAVTIARAVGYIGAGTVEFLIDREGRFYFIEMNTRLQVEHPVTEMISGLDLIEWQLLVASGSRLPLSQHQIVFRGHAIEARIYAENSAYHFLPATGTIQVLKFPSALAFESPGSSGPPLIRIDSGVRQGDSITPYYDPLIAKIIAWGNDRNSATTHLRQALADSMVVGLPTNREFLWQLAGSSDFINVNLDTGIVDRYLGSAAMSAHPAPFPFVALATAALLKREESETRAEANDPFSPWTTTIGWRLNGESSRTFYWQTSNQTIETKLTYGTKGYLLDACGKSAWFSTLEQQDDRFVLIVDTERVAGAVCSYADGFHVVIENEQIDLHRIDPVESVAYAEQTGGTLNAPMPGKIVAVLVNNHQPVTKGSPLVTMEAMKMEHTVVAVEDGVVDEVLFNVGDQVAEGTQLLRFTPSNP